MDLVPSPQEVALRRQVRAFIQKELSPETHRKMLEGRVPSREEVVAWQRTLNRRGWATPSWPKQWGGPGWSPIERAIFFDELHQAPAPEPVSFNVAMLGPVLIRYGTEEQKSRFLPATANLDIWWCQGFSEPGAGSDLAAVRTTGVRMSGGADDYFLINGHKIWQGMAHHANWMFILVRTDPNASKRQAGLTFLLLDMTLPGVNVRPIITIDGRHEVNEVFLDDVRVPVDCLIGIENDGWTMTKALLSNERTNIARIGMTKHILRRIKTIGSEDASVAKRAAAIEAELRVLEVTQLRILTAQSGVDGADPRSSILKLKGVELRQAASELLMQAVGTASLRADPAGPEAIANPVGTALPNYAILRAASIYGGASEIQKTIIAKSVLGL